MEGKREEKQNRSDKKHRDNHKDKEKKKRVSPYNWDESAITSKTVVPDMPSQLLPKPDYDGQKKAHAEIMSEIDELKKQKKEMNASKPKSENSDLKKKIGSCFQLLETQNAELKEQIQINKQSNDDQIMGDARLEFLKKREDDIFIEIKAFQNANRQSGEKPAPTINKKDQEKILRIQKEVQELVSKLAPFQSESVKQMSVKSIKENMIPQLTDFDPNQMSDESYAQVFSIFSQIEALQKKESKVIKFSKPDPRDEKDQENKKPKRMNEKEIKEKIQGIESSVDFSRLTPEQSKELNLEISNLKQQLKFEESLREVREERKQVDSNLKNLRDASHKSFQQMKALRAAIKKTRDEIDENKNNRTAQLSQSQINEQEDDSNDSISEQIAFLRKRWEENNQQFDEIVAQYDEQQDLVKYIKFIKHKQYLLRQEAKQQKENS